MKWNLQLDAIEDAAAPFFNIPHDALSVAVELDRPARGVKEH
jgi:hypothetical protein